MFEDYMQLIIHERASVMFIATRVIRVIASTNAFILSTANAERTEAWQYHSTLCAL